MIKSILDNDLYKFTMQNAVLQMFPRANVRFKFINRGKTEFPCGFDEALKTEIQKLSNKRLSREEKEYLRKICYYLPPTYLDFLSGYQFNPDEVQISQNGGDLSVITEGYWYRTILWEVPLMAIISELYFKMTDQQPFSTEKITEIVRQKVDFYDKLEVRVADFGTRRRFSSEVHNLVVSELKKHSRKSFFGSSNVYKAMKYGVTPIGTHAHEWFMFHAAKYGYKMSNKLALENWVKVFRGDLGIALSDTFTSEVFFRAFDTKFAKLFDGVRHDSGDPIEFADKTIEHYKKLRIDPLSKAIVFSDGLKPQTVEKIANYCQGKIKMSFGIGTNFTNDVGVKPLNIVVKIVEAQPEGQDWTPTIKLSDVAGKHTGDKNEIELCKGLLKIK